jgi:putative photosynthetic complex assembly protein
MRNALDDSHISPNAILIAGCLMFLAVFFVTTWQLTGTEHTHVATAAVVESRAIRFEDRADGGINVYDSGAAQPFEVIAPQTNGFLRGTLRGLARGRKLSGVGQEPPFELTRWADGRLSLVDPTTQRDISLEPFGPTNIAVFKRLLTLKANAS